MREINQAEIKVVSGAGLSQAPGLFNSSVLSHEQLYVSTEKFGQTFKTLNLMLAKDFLSAFSGFLSKFA